MSTGRSDKESRLLARRIAAELNPSRPRNGQLWNPNTTEVNHVDATINRKTAGLLGISDGAYLIVDLSAGNVSNGDTITLAGKTYTFETTLTDVDGNVDIGVDANGSLDNLVAAITLTGSAGTDYATSMTQNSNLAGGVVGTTTAYIYAFANASTLVASEASTNMTIEDEDGTAVTSFQTPSAGEGQLIVGSINGALSIDGGAPSIGNTILIDDMAHSSTANKVYNGIWDVKYVGDTNNSWVMERNASFDGSGELYETMAFKVSAGTTYSSTYWHVDNEFTEFTFGTSFLTFTQKSYGKAFSFYVGSSGTLNIVNMDGTTLAMTASEGWHPYVVRQITTGGTCSNLISFGEDKIIFDE